MDVDADRSGNVVATLTVPNGTFPRDYRLALLVDCNGKLQRAERQVTVTNEPPEAADDQVSTARDTPVTIDVTGNDRDPDGDDGYRTRVLASRRPAHGTAEVQSDQTIRYTPGPRFVGQDRFRYSVCDDILNTAGRADCDSATVTVTVKDPRACLPAAGDTPTLRLEPGRGPHGARLHITARVDRRLAACPVRFLFGGSPLGPDESIGPDGSISAERDVPSGARLGPSPVRLETTSGQPLAEAPFQIVSRWPWPGWLPRLLVGAGAFLAGVLGRAAFRRWRGARDGHEEPPPRPGDVRAEPHPSPGDVTVEPDPDRTRTYAVRLEPHHDPGAQTMQEVSP